MFLVLLTFQGARQILFLKKSDYERYFSVTLIMEVVIVGAGEHAGVAANIFSYDSGVRVLGFLDRESKRDPYLGTDKDAEKFIRQGCYFFVAIGDTEIREKVFRALKERGAVFTNAIHPTALIDKNVHIDEGVMIGARAFIHTGAIIGDGVIINSGCLVEHDAIIEPFVHLAPGVVTGGSVRVGRGTFIGLRSVINDHITIGERTVVGSGSVVVDDLPAYVTAVGHPAKIIKQRR